MFLPWFLQDSSCGFVPATYTKFTSNMCKRSVVTDVLRCKKRLRRAIHYLPSTYLHIRYTQVFLN